MIRTIAVILAAIAIASVASAQLIDVTIHLSEQIRKNAFPAPLIRQVAAPAPGAAPVDPGIRSGAAGAGGFLAGLSADEVNFANAAAMRFEKIWSVSGAIPGEAGIGLGPRYSTNGCSACHAFPAIGGSSPPTNPEIAMATLDGATNAVPSFITANGPVRIAFQPSNGRLLKLYTIQGRTDARGCVLKQPDFARLVANNDISFHIPIPLFGSGLVEQTPNANLIAAQNASVMTSLGITPGRFNYSGDGTISRMGWKAAASSLEYFAAFALNVDVGVTTEIFPREGDETASCQFNSQPEDRARQSRNTPNTSSITSDYASDMVNTAKFSQYLAPPTPIADTPSTANGRAKFISVGCAACHIQFQTTGNSSMTGQSKFQYSPWSDYAIHNMGVGLRDGISEGAAGPQDFKTSALWGIGQRIFFLHDGRTTDIYQAILDHASSDSEANTVISSFNALSISDQQDILNFLRAL
jgi:CxxC motif-containing protein (DUF1111 family)